jgi:signal transduction histidine kinase
MPRTEEQHAAAGRRALQLPFRRQLGLAYVATLCLLAGVEGLWYHSVTELETTLQLVEARGRGPAAEGTPALPLDTFARRTLSERRDLANAAVTRTVAVTAVAFVLAFAITGLAILRTEREMDRRRDAEHKAVEARDVAERMSQAKSEFLTNVSHELRTPLNSVIGFSNVLLRRAALRPEGLDQEYLMRIRDNGTHLLTLIDDILDLSRIESGKERLEIGLVLLDRLITETTSQLEGRLVGKAVALRVEVPAVIAPLATDERKLKQVLINLIGNAIKFTEGGTVTVRATVDAETAEAIRLEVVDTGIGIPAARLAVIFQPFEQGDSSTARRHEGTGLGLAIARSYCELMGYRLLVESAPGVGSTFRVELKPGPTHAVTGLPAPALSAPSPA